MLVQPALKAEKVGSFIIQSACLLRHFNEKLFDEVFCVIGDSAETVIVKLPVASANVVQRVLIVAASKRRQSAQTDQTHTSAFRY